MKTRALWILAGVLAAGFVPSSVARESASLTVPLSDQRIFLSPYCWRLDSTGDAICPAGGGYLKFRVSGTTRIALRVNTAINRGLADWQMPTLKVVVNQPTIDGTAEYCQLPANGSADTEITLASGLNPAVEYSVLVFATGGDQRVSSGWTGTVFQTQINRLVLDAGADLLPPILRPKRALFLGASYEQAFFGHMLPKGPIFKMVDASSSWPFFVAYAFHCEYGQVGIGSQGWVRHGDGGYPPFPESWDHFDARYLKRFGHDLDYVFVHLAENDAAQSDAEVERAVATWIPTARAAFGPKTRIFIVLSLPQIKSAPIKAGVRAVGDARTYVLDPGQEYRHVVFAGRPTWVAPYDGLHPDPAHQALFTAFVTRQAQACLDRTEAPLRSVSTRTVPITDSHILLAPYVWKCTGSGAGARAEAAMPGAYLKAWIRGTVTIALEVDGAANVGVPADKLPIVDCSVDGGAFRSFRLRADAQVYVLPLVDRLNPTVVHRLDVVFRSAQLDRRWEGSPSHLRLAGLALSQDATLLPPRRRPHNAIAFGDSITEGVLVEGPGAYYADLSLNNAGVTWVSSVCRALDAEYGQLGTGGQGMVRKLEIPPLPLTWDKYDATSSRLTGGRLVPDPDYVFCLMGTNDGTVSTETIFGLPVWHSIKIAGAYRLWLRRIRESCPQAAIFCITPPTGLHAAEIAAAVRARKQAGDPRTFLIDTTCLKGGFVTIHYPGPDIYIGKPGPTQLAVDGTHPSRYGDAALAAVIAAQAAQDLGSVDR